MIYRVNRQCVINRYARLVLVLFVLAVINMSIQVPAHAVMQQSMLLMPAMDMTDMGDTDMPNCKCPPLMCESVDSFNDKSIESLSSISFNHLLGFQPTYSTLLTDVHQQPSSIIFNYHEWQYRQFSPPPLTRSSILHI